MYCMWGILGGEKVVFACAVRDYLCMRKNEIILKRRSKIDYSHEKRRSKIYLCYLCGNAKLSTNGRKRC